MPTQAETHKLGTKTLLDRNKTQRSQEVSVTRLSVLVWLDIVFSVYISARC